MALRHRRQLHSVDVGPGQARRPGRYLNIMLALISKSVPLLDPRCQPNYHLLFTNPRGHFKYCCGLNIHHEAALRVSIRASYEAEPRHMLGAFQTRMIDFAERLPVTDH